MRALAVTLLLATLVPRSAAAGELHLLDTRLALRDRRAAKAVVPPAATKPPPTPKEKERPWDGAATLSSIIAGDAGLLLSLGVDLIGALAASGIGAAGDSDSFVTIGEAFGFAAALVFVPGAVLMSAKSYGYQPSFAASMLATAAGLGVSELLYLAFDSPLAFIFFAIIPATLATVGALTSSPPLPPPPPEPPPEEDPFARTRPLPAPQRVQPPPAVTFPALAFRF